MVRRASVLHRMLPLSAPRFHMAWFAHAGFHEHHGMLNATLRHRLKAVPLSTTAARSRPRAKRLPVGSKVSVEQARASSNFVLNNQPRLASRHGLQQAELTNSSRSRDDIGSLKADFSATS
ncbi:unnamed protein product [Symbiodinium natans]|uniref:Uncharacterized protein n=1 Tax=Symbiodinium natans TaxID=878477 RepID=A0A812UCU9_9DINO|nr:unnamed protein product [Symbiodinium natans]